jgi:hypothetical protein
MHRLLVLVPLLLIAHVAGCAKKTTADAGATGLEGAAAPQGTSLAYEHAAELDMADGAAVSVAAERIAAACREQRFGDCALLELEQSGGEWPSASVRMRLAPDGVAPTLQLATDAGGTLTRRTTKAEDLAGALSDLRRERESLEAQRTRLESAVAGRNTSATDAIALAAELGRIDARLAELDAGERAQQRRIDTNLLSVEMRATAGQPGALSAFDGLGGRVVSQFADGIAEALAGLAYLLPLVLVLMLPALGLALLWRRLWRWATRPTP